MNFDVQFQRKQVPFQRFLPDVMGMLEKGYTIVLDFRKLEGGPCGCRTPVTMEHRLLPDGETVHEHQLRASDTSCAPKHATFPYREYPVRFLEYMRHPHLERISRYDSSDYKELLKYKSEVVIPDDFEETLEEAREAAAEKKPSHKTNAVLLALALLLVLGVSVWLIMKR